MLITSYFGWPVMNTRYMLGAVLALPTLPWMYMQGKRIRAKVPKLPEANGTQGIVSRNSDRTIRLLALGESTIAGVGVDTHEEGFTGTLASALARQLDADVHWKVYARSGYTARRIKEKIIPKVPPEPVDIVVIGLGGNDAFGLNSPGKWRDHIWGLIEEIKKRFGNTPIAFTNMPPIKEFPAFTPLIKFMIGNLVEILGDELEDLALDEQGVYYYPRKITLKDWIERLKVQAEPSDFFSDGVHPSKLTYQVWARDFANFLLEESGIRSVLEQSI